MICWAAAAINS